MSYDPRCYELAKAFADDATPRLNGIEVDELAQSIQDGIEAYLEAREGKGESKWPTKLPTTT